MIPKPSGGMRKLGVPAVVDRLICQAIAQVLTPIFDPQFHPHSFGFRPGRSQHQAVKRARQFIADDAAWCVDFDLDSFFDRVQHDALMARVARRVHDKRVLGLIRRYLEAGVMEGGLVAASEEGTPQGSPLTAPTQKVTWVIGACGGGDCVADGDRVVVASDEDFADDEPQNALLFLEAQLIEPGGESAEEPFEAVGELEVGLGVVQLCLERVELGAQGALAL